MLNGRSKGDSASLRSFRPGRLQPHTSNPVARSHSNAQFGEKRTLPPDLKTFQPIKLSLSPRKKNCETGKQLRISAKPSNDWEEQPEAEVLFPSHVPEIPLISSPKNTYADEKAIVKAEPLLEILCKPSDLHLTPPPKPQPSNTSSKVQLRTSLETALSGLTPRLFTQLPTKPPSVEVERVYHLFVGLVTTVETDAQPDPFQITHHKAWKTLRKLTKTPGKVISSAKSVAKSIKNGTFRSENWPNLMEDLRAISNIKITDEDAVASALAAYLQALGSQYRAMTLEKELTKKSLDYMEVEDDSPRRKLLQSLLNRSVEGVGERSSYVPPEGRKSDHDLSPHTPNPFPLYSPEVTPPPKPTLRKADSPAIHLNLSKLRTKSPDAHSARKTTPKTTPRKRGPTNTERDTAAEEPDPLFLTMMLDVKFSVFIREKLRLPSFHLPETDSDFSSLRSSFQTWVKSTDLTVSDELLSRFTANIDREYLKKNLKKTEIGSGEQVPSWTEMSLRRDKAKLAVELKPVGKK